MTNVDDRLAAGGIPDSLRSEDAIAQGAVLHHAWYSQMGREPGPLADDLEALSDWFDPTKPGEKLRAAVDRIRPTEPGYRAVLAELVARDLLLEAGRDRYIVSPEGRGFIELYPSVRQEPLETWVRPTPALVDSVDRAIHNVYRQWTSRKLQDVIGLLTGKSTQSMRPAASGLLVFLLVNRHTDPTRPLRKFQGDEFAGRLVTNAIAPFVAAFATPFGRGSSDANNAVNVYRGWAYGELARRLGSAFQNLDDVAYLTDEDVALDRLVEEMAKRPPQQRKRIPEAFQAALTQLVQQRATLSGLGMAFDRPAHTARIESALNRVAAG
jgi:hypothetical protein